MYVRRKKPQIYLFEGPFFTNYVNPNDERTYQKFILLTKKLTNKHTVTVIIGESQKGRAYTEKGVVMAIVMIFWLTMRMRRTLKYLGFRWKRKK